MFRVGNAPHALACLPLLLAAALQSGSCRAGDVVPGGGAAGVANGNVSEQRARPAANRDDNANPKAKMEDSQERKDARASDDTWGGDHIRLVVREGGADIEYDCAHGTMDAPLDPDDAGRFDVAGHHVREGPGPIRLGKAPPSRPARYTGQVSGPTMMLTVTLTDTSQEVGVFTLTRGREGRLRKCR
ncbi:MAG TPA: hypothetical protein VF240_12745 [Pyrinomonadaceae bacterium]